jgi:hypothetical protein
MNRGDLLYLTLKGLLAWLLLSGLVWYGGAWLVQGLLPLIKAVIMSITSEISPSLKLMPSTSDASIELSAWVLKPIYLNVSQFIPPGTELKSSAHLLHSLVPLVIEGSILLVWPVRRWRQRWLLMTFGLLTASLVIMATLPALLLGQLEISFQDVAITGKNPRMVPWFVDWMVFCELGGRWLLAISAAWLSIQIQRGLQFLFIPVQP